MVAEKDRRRSEPVAMATERCYDAILLCYEAMFINNNNNNNNNVYFV